MKRRPSSWAAVVAISVVLLSSMILGFFVMVRLVRHNGRELEFFRAGLLIQSSSLNRVLLAAERYATYPPNGRGGAEWTAGKIEVCRALVSHAEIPRFVSAGTFSRFIRNDPLMLAPQLEEAENAYREKLGALSECYGRLARAETPAGRDVLFAEFDGIFRAFVEVLKDRNRVLTQMEGTYNAQQRENLRRDGRNISSAIIAQGIALPLAFGIVVLAFRSQSRRVKELSGLIPICSHCKKVRDDKGYWKQVEAYIRDHSEADFSHGICPDCARLLYPEYVGEEPQEGVLSESRLRRG